MKKIIALVLAALMMFTLVAPASAADAEIPEEIVKGITSILPKEVTEKVNVFALFMASIEDFVHKLVGTITQFFGSDCPFCDNGTHLVGIPSAKVEVLDEQPVVNVGGDDYVLDIAYNFQPSEELTGKAEEYRYWIVDYVIKTDKDLENVLLAGAYENWADGAYVGFFVDKIEADKEVRLLKDYSAQYNGGKEVSVNAEEVFNNVKSFNCGIYNGSEANVGATITVELRMYETKPREETGTLNSTNVETGRFVTIATVPCTISALAA